MARKLTDCTKYRCAKPHYKIGFCEEHYHEHKAEKLVRDEAINALHFSKVDNDPFQDKTIREELYKIQRWWQRSCSAINFGKNDDILKDETEIALEWCISLAQELVKAEKRYRQNKPVLNYELKSTQDWVWERFNNLEKGFRSNGLLKTS